MIPFIELNAFAQGFVGLCIVFLLFATVMNVVLEISHRHLKYVWCLIVLAILLYGAFQCICDICSHMKTQYSLLNHIEDCFGQIPIWIFTFLILGIAGIETFIFNQNKKWNRENITPSSIKEAIDNLPIGICCYDHNGQVMMKNNMMEHICQAYTGDLLLNAVSFYNALHSDKNYADEVVIVLEDEKVFSIADNQFSEEEPTLRVMTATDITEQYKNTMRLKEQQETVVKLNKELSDYGKQIVSSITAKEVLNAKIKIHDEIGANLLAIKRYILNGGGEEERIAIESILHKNLQYLKNATEVVEKDEYAVILETAEKLDMNINVVGVLTEIEPYRHVIVTGIHECLTNTIRHAKGDTLTVVLKEDDDMIIAKFTNNGKEPEKEIKERGGLVLLGALVDECGGTMQILCKPRFELTINLPKEVTRHAK